MRPVKCADGGMLDLHRCLRLIPAPKNLERPNGPYVLCAQPSGDSKLIELGGEYFSRDEAARAAEKLFR